MIRAQQKGLSAWLWRHYVLRKVRRAFHGLWRRGALPPLPTPILLYANHPNFWDGFAAYALCVASGRQFYCMMEERQLARYPFLTHLGAFSVRRGDPYGALGSMRYAKALLRQPGAAVLIFPEGELRVGTPLPLELEPGLALLAKNSGAACVPMALRYAFFVHELPELLVEIGPSHQGALADPLAHFSAQLTTVVQQVNAARSTDDFTPVLRGRRSVAERWDAWRGRS